MSRHAIATGAMLALLMLAGCSGTSADFAYSQQRAISADMDASLQHGPTVADHEMGVRFNNDLDASTNNRPASLGGALGFR